jgi:UDP-2,3-diacylglucosamine pyrophosphatase LpxH
VILAHLSDLHLRDEGDAVEFDRQLDCIAAEHADHLVIAGDILDRWHPPLLARVLDALEARGFLDPARVTIIHGNHDFASSGGHPRQQRDLLRLALRFWDPPPLLRHRRRTFYEMIAARHAALGRMPPFSKELDGGVTLAVVDSVPFPWVPFTLGAGGITLQHARGAIAERDLAWLAAQRSERLAVLIHHYPLEAGAFSWRYDRWRSEGSSRWLSSLGRLKVTIPMDVDDADRGRFWEAMDRSQAFAVFCGHIHRARVDYRGGVAVALNGQSGAEWAGRTIAFYRIEGRSVVAEQRQLSRDVVGS